MTNAVYYSQFPGLGNYLDKNFSFSIPAQTLDGSVFPSEYYEITQSVAIDNTSAISQILVEFAGLDNVNYYIRGLKEWFYIGSTRVYDIFSSDYSVNLDCYYDSGFLFFHIVIAPTQPILVNVPAITVNTITKLFLAPFD